MKLNEASVPWNAERRALMAKMRAERYGWGYIALALRISETAALAEAKRMGIYAEAQPPVVPAQVAPARPPAPVLEAPTRHNWRPLDAGHPTTWGAITAGLRVLDGVPYPWRPPA